MFLELFNRPGESPRSAASITRRLILWSLVCWVSAAPSFVLAFGNGGARKSGVSGTGFDPWAMSCAIVLFSLLYTALTSTDAFDRFHRIHGMRRTLYIGYWTRIFASIAFPITLFADIITGIVSVGLVEKLLGAAYGFGPTFLITCVHGAIMNLLIVCYMAILFPIVRAVTKDPRLRPGFEVVMGNPGQVATAEVYRPEVPPSAP